MGQAGKLTNLFSDRAKFVMQNPLETISQFLSCKIHSWRQAWTIFRRERILPPRPRETRNGSKLKLILFQPIFELQARPPTQQKKPYTDIPQQSNARFMLLSCMGFIAENHPSISERILEALPLVPPLLPPHRLGPLEERCLEKPCSRL